VDFMVTFSEDVTGVDTSAPFNDFLLATTGVLGAAVTFAVSEGGTASDDVWNVTVDTGDGDGTLRLDVADDDSIQSASSQPLGGAGAGNGDYALGESYTVDKSAPACDAIAPSTPSPTNGDTVSFAVHFDESVAYFDDATDVVVTPTGSAANTGVLIASAKAEEYTVTLTGVTGDGDLSLAVRVGSDVADPAGNPLGSSVISPPVTVDHTSPTCDTITPVTPSPTSAGLVSFTVHFDDDVQYFDDPSDLLIAATGTVANTGVLITAAKAEEYTVALTGVTGDGDLSLAVRTDSDIADLAGNPLGSSATSPPVVIDHTPPTAMISRTGSSPTARDAVVFLVNFGETVAPTFTQDDVTLAPGSLAGSVAVLSLDPAYIVTVTLADPDVDGTVGIEVGTAVTDPAGNPYAGGTSPLYIIHNWSGFTTQPRGTKLYTGDTYTLSVNADYGGVTPAFQWWWDDEMGGGAKTVYPVGENLPAYTLSPATSAARGGYWCNVTYDDSVYSSNTAVLEIEDHVAITQPPAGADKLVGQAHTFSVVATGGYEPLEYLWEKDGVSLPGRTGDSFSLDPLDVSDSGSYTVQVSDANSDVLESAPAELRVTQGLPVAAGFLGLGLLFAACVATGVAATRRSR